MRIKGIRGNDSETPNELIQSCVSDAEKRRVLMKLRVCWNRYDRRLAIYDSDGRIIGIAFADDDGTIREVAGPMDLTTVLPAMSDAVRKTVAAQRQQVRDAYSDANDGSRGTLTRTRLNSAGEAGALRQDDGAHVMMRSTGDLTPYPDDDWEGHDDDDYSLSDAVSEPSAGILQDGGKAGARRQRKKGHAGVIVVLTILVAVVAACFMLAYHVGPFADVEIPFGDRVASIIEMVQAGYAGAGGGDGGGTSPQYAQIADDQEVTVVISSGDTIQNVIAELRKAGLPDQAGSMYQVMDSNGTLSKIQPGSYHFKGSESAETIAERIASGQFYPDGYLGVDGGTTIRTLAKKVQSGKFQFTDADFTAAMDSPQAYKADYRMLGAIPDDLQSLEGFVPAGVYDLSGCKTADEAVRKLLDAGEKRFESSGMDASTWFRTLTEASMLDKEIIYDSERKTVASVIDNRLAQDMPLQIDATVLYALGRDTGIPSLTDIEVDSPYNTYKNKGLPIGPICSGVSQTSIDAVMNHPQTQYLYYCLAPTNDGHHVFAVTYEEHQQNQAAYEAAVNSGNAGGSNDGASDGADGTTTTQ